MTLSNVRLIHSTDFAIEVAKGNISGTTYINKFGRNIDIDTAADEDLWDGGGKWVEPTVDRVHNIVSTDANDTSGGSGCKGVTVQGLSSGVVTQELITTNGTSNVATSNSYGIIYRMFATVGLGSGSNVGVISATAVTDSTVTAQINSGNNQTLMAVYQVPTGTKGYMMSYFTSVNKQTPIGVAVNTCIMVKETGGVDHIEHVLGLSRDGTSYVHHTFSVPPQFSAGTILKIRVACSANDTDCSGGFDVVIVDN